MPHCRVATRTADASLKQIALWYVCPENYAPNRHQLRGARLARDPAQQLASHPGLDQPVTVLGEAGVIPDRLIDRQSHEPANHQVVVQLLAQESFNGDRVQKPQCRGSHQPLLCDRGPSLRGIHPVKVPSHAGQRRVQLPDAAQWVPLRHLRLQRDLAEQSALLKIGSAHHISLFR